MSYKSPSDDSPDEPKQKNKVDEEALTLRCPNCQKIDYIDLENGTIYCNKCSTIHEKIDCSLSDIQHKLGPDIQTSMFPEAVKPRRLKDILEEVKPKKKKVLNQEDVPKDRIIEAVKADLDDRSQRGLLKYGVSLERRDLNLYDWLKHAYEECLDQANYLKRCMLEIRLIQEIQRRTKAMWTCDCGNHTETSWNDIADVGTPVCSVCDKDMTLMKSKEDK